MSDWRANSPFRKIKSLSPRVKRAIALYGTTACKTKRESSATVGLHPAYLHMLIKQNPLAQEELRRVMMEVDTATLDIGKLLHAMSIKALAKIHSTMEEASSEALRFKAAQDLADRGPQTSKVQRHQVETHTINASDAKSIAEAMVEAAKVRATYSHVAVGSHDATGVSTPKLLGDGSGS